MSVVAIPTYLSRVTHLMGGAVMLVVILAPKIFEGDMKLKMGSKGVAGLGVLIVATGIYNAIMLQPKKMGEKAGTWRKLIYGGKLALAALCTPLSDKIFGEHATNVKIASMAASVLIGSYCRYYREAAVREEEQKNSQR
eukprot:TRINITY_DN1042_c0_g1_i1.p1 TRINITY_DN1042_c0_g1~~TRINITY_DN1042_c0_g1_i1.p1  ORF type:complete len:156 (+),score=42.33 TRINITY_DN1042_c0_g1_i1:52-468(+)